MGQCPDPENCPQCREAREKLASELGRIQRTTKEQRAAERAMRRWDAIDARKAERRARKGGAQR